MLQRTSFFTSSLILGHLCIGVGVGGMRASQKVTKHDKGGEVVSRKAQNCMTSLKYTRRYRGLAPVEGLGSPSAHPDSPGFTWVNPGFTLSQCHIFFWGEKLKEYFSIKR